MKFIQAFALTLAGGIFLLACTAPVRDLIFTMPVRGIADRHFFTRHFSASA